MIGVRRDYEEGRIPLDGEYGKFPNGEWFACAPGELLANLSAHTVIEHEAGTITVSPSILVGDFVNRATGQRDNAIETLALAEGRAWHGFLERGVWRSV
jgi:hypothetical protein